MFKHIVILAAGRSVRMWPLTEYVPKAMALADGKTLIEAAIAKYHQPGMQLHVTVGYKASVLAEHVLPLGVNTLVNTSGHGNSWWIYRSVLAYIDEPVVVFTCDSLMDIDLVGLEQAYTAAGRPACMLLPTTPREGFDGDYIHHSEGIVTSLSREHKTDIYGSGCQVLNPAQVVRTTEFADDFLDVWRQLISQQQLQVANFTVTNWFTFDTVEQLKLYKAQKQA